MSIKVEELISRKSYPNAPTNSIIVNKSMVKPVRFLYIYAYENNSVHDDISSRAGSLLFYLSLWFLIFAFFHTFIYIHSVCMYVSSKALTSPYILVWVFYARQCYKIQILLYGCILLSKWRGVSPCRHMTSKQRRIDVDALQRWYNVVLRVGACLAVTPSYADQKGYN